MAKAKRTMYDNYSNLQYCSYCRAFELSCIIVVENMAVDNDTLDKAKELNIPIFKTSESAYQVACRLSDMGIK